MDVGSIRSFISSGHNNFQERSKSELPQTDDDSKTSLLKNRSLSAFSELGSCFGQLKNDSKPQIFSPENSKGSEERIVEESLQEDLTSTTESPDDQNEEINNFETSLDL